MANAAWYLLVACIPLGTRAFLGLASPALPEYTSLFVYATDLLVLFIVSRAVIFRSQPARLGWESLFLKGFVVSAVLSIFLSTVPALAFYQTIRLILFVCFASLLATFFSLKKTFQAVLAWIGAAALVESILAISQFISGKSLGLYFFGESPISPTLAGVGKITIGGLRFVRGYGTFPHPNVLAAFLFSAYSRSRIYIASTTNFCIDLIGGTQ